MTTEREALDRIAAYCDEVDPANLDEHPLWPRSIRAILAEVDPQPAPKSQHVSWRNTAGLPQPEPAGENGGERAGRVGREHLAVPAVAAFPREQVRRILLEHGALDSRIVDAFVEHLLDALAALWPAPVPPHTIDRDALITLLADRFGIEDGLAYPAPQVADAILALVQPAGGVTLTAEEAHLLAEPVSKKIERYPFDDEYLDQLDALLQKLEAAS